MLSFDSFDTPATAENTCSQGAESGINVIARSEATWQSRRYQSGLRPQPNSARRSAVPLASRARGAGAALFARRLATSGLNNLFFIAVPES